MISLKKRDIKKALKAGAKHYLPMAVLALAVAAGCDSKKEAVMTSGIDLTNLDTTAVQGADCGCCLWIYIHAGNSPE